MMADFNYARLTAEGVNAIVASVEMQFDWTDTAYPNKLNWPLVKAACHLRAIVECWEAGPEHMLLAMMAPVADC